MKDAKLVVVEGAIPDGLGGHLFVVAPVGNHGDTDGEPRRNTLLNGDGMVYRFDFDPGNQCAYVTSRLVKPFCFFAEEEAKRFDEETKRLNDAAGGPDEAADGPDEAADGPDEAADGPDEAADGPDEAADGPDEATQRPTFSFLNLGIARMSPRLGTRNFGNTALVPMPTRDGTRLLVTYDVGRPIEIDPVTLETITPVGKNNEWKGEFGEDFPDQPFKLVLTTAHPVWDMKTGHLFTVNYTRHSSSIFNVKPPAIRHSLTKGQLSSVRKAPGPNETAKDPDTTVGDVVEDLVEWLQRNMPDMAKSLSESLELNPNWLEAVQGTVSTIWSFAVRLAKSITHESGLRLVRWDGHGELESWDVVLRHDKDIKPVRIQNSMHQLAVTRDYIILADTSFKVAVSQFQSKNELPLVYDKLIRLLHSRRALPDMPIYIIRRADLEEAKKDGKVEAKAMRLPFSAVHFLADYDNPKNRITLHAGHSSAVDIAEWVREHDTLSWLDGEKKNVDNELLGMVTGAADVSRLGRYVIDLGTGSVQERTLVDPDAMWTLALYTAHGVPAWGQLPDRHERLYWFSNGFWPELLTDFVLNLYADAPARVMTVDQVQAVGRSETPPSPCLFSVKTSTMTIVDRYHLTGGRIMSSPQFVPHPSGAKNKGWIAALVVVGEEGEEPCQLWIFDAFNLQGGPVARLASPEFKFGFTLHAAWLPRIESSKSKYRVDPKEDYDIDGDADPDLKKFFDRVLEEYGKGRSSAPDKPGEGGSGG
ncbi:carotenoid oxygenase family protein [Sorangium sp. So ce216]